MTVCLCVIMGYCTATLALFAEVLKRIKQKYVVNQWTRDRLMKCCFDLCSRWASKLCSETQFIIIKNRKCSSIQFYLKEMINI